MATSIVTNEPRFHGPNVVGKTSAEDFLLRVENMAISAAPAWGDDVAAAKAVSYLRDDANAWLEGMRLADNATYTAIKTDFQVFKTEFKKAFFRMTTCEDVSMCWTTMKQGDKEPVNIYCYKVLQAMDRYIQLLPYRHLPQTMTDGFMADLAAFEAAQNAQTRQALIDRWAAGTTLAGVSNKEAVGQDLAMKFAAEGIKSAKLKEKARAELRKRLPTKDTIQALTETEKVLAGTPTQEVRNGQKNGGQQRGNGNGNPYANISEVNHDGEIQDDSSVDAVQKPRANKKKKPKPGNGNQSGQATGGQAQGGARPKGNAAGGSANANQGSAFQQWRATARCFNCNGMGHLRTECDKPPKGVSVADEIYHSGYVGQDYNGYQDYNGGPRDNQGVGGLQHRFFGDGGRGGGGGRRGAGRAGSQSGNA
jgi:hypothetical protein